MPRSCSIYYHPQRQAIDQALRAGEAFQNIGTRLGTSTAAVHRDKHTHLWGHTTLPAAAAPVTQAPSAPVREPLQDRRAIWQAVAACRNAEVGYRLATGCTWPQLP